MSNLIIVNSFNQRIRFPHGYILRQLKCCNFLNQLTLLLLLLLQSSQSSFLLFCLSSTCLLSSRLSLPCKSSSTCLSPSCLSSYLCSSSCSSSCLSSCSSFCSSSCSSSCQSSCWLLLMLFLFKKVRYRGSNSSFHEPRCPSTLMYVWFCV